MSAADEKASLAAQLQAKEEALKTAMNKRSDYDPTEVKDLESQVSTAFLSEQFYTEAYF